MGDIVSLKHDFSFKHVFLNEEIRRYFISDALGIPAEEIRSVRLANTFLWKQFRRQKQGILEAIKEVRVMSLGKRWKVMYDAHMKHIRDQNARDDYVRKEGIEQGIEQGSAIKIIQQIRLKLQKGKTAEEIAEDLEEPRENVERICDAIERCGSEDAAEIYRFMRMQ